MSKSFNIASLKTDDSAVLHLRSPATDELLYADDEKKLPVTITLFGSSSSQYRNAINAMQNRALKRGKKQASAEIMREESTELLVACFKEASNFDYDGQAINEAGFRAVLEDSGLSFVRDQVDSFIGEQSNFLKAAANS
jgi:hypothetical protein